MAGIKCGQIAFPAGESEYRAARLRCALACRRYNEMPEDATVEQRSKLWQSIVTTGSLTPPCEEELEAIAAGSSISNPFGRGSPYVKPPVYMDYGTNVHVGASTFINRNFTVCDTPICPVKIGERCLIGPNTSIYAVGHPLDYRERAGPLGAPSLASSVTIEDDCWIGGGVIIMPGVRIGRGCVIGAGSVVTKDVPPEHLAYGNPARVIRKVASAAAAESDHGEQISPALPSPDSDAAAAAKSDPSTTNTTAPPHALSCVGRLLLLLRRLSSAAERRLLPVLLLFVSLVVLLRFSS